MLWIEATEPLGSSAWWRELARFFLAKEPGGRFELHCWREEKTELQKALAYGRQQHTDWDFGVVVAGEITEDFASFLLAQVPEAGEEPYEKMTPFFNVSLGERFFSSHYGRELALRPESEEEKAAIGAILAPVREKLSLLEEEEQNGEDPFSL